MNTQRSRKRFGWPGAAAVLLLCAALLVALEVSFFHWFPRLMPRLVEPLVADGAQVLLQTSKRGVLPRDYVLLLGDSYAQGQGDWLIEQLGVPGPDFHSAHLLYRQTGRDVLSLGSGGAGSVRGLITEPVSTLAYLRASRWPALADPAVMLVYFYEGNDLSDNIEYHAQSFRDGFDPERVRDRAYYQTYLQAFAVEQDSLYRQAQAMRWHDRLYFLPFAARLTVGLALALPGRWSDEAGDGRNPFNPPGRFSWTEPGQVNRALVAGAPRPLPDYLQGPVPDLDAAELDLALYLYEASLQDLRRRFPAVPLGVVYIPSVLSSYALLNDTVRTQSPMRREREYPLAMLQQRQQALREAVRERTEAAGGVFADATPALQAHTRQYGVVHGPQDWNHLNRDGYTVLAGVAAELLARLPEAVRSGR